jgi:two-component system phosphate regulon response regulator PhoB
MVGDPEVNRRVLVVDDEPDVRESLVYNLSAAGFHVRECGTGHGAVEMLQRFSVDVVLLDLVLPDMAGTQVCKWIRRESSGQQPAVMMLTAKGDEIDRIVGFELGADDYVVKPFSMRELVLRVRAVLRGRSPATRPAIPPPRRLLIGSLELDADSHRVFLDGNEIELSKIEMRFLWYLAENCGRVLSRENLLQHVWHYQSGVSTRTIDCHVARLRDKLGDAAPLLQTVRGAGYRLGAAVCKTDHPQVAYPIGHMSRADVTDRARDQAG